MIKLDNQDCRTSELLCICILVCRLGTSNVNQVSFRTEYGFCNSFRQLTAKVTRLLIGISQVQERLAEVVPDQWGAQKGSDGHCP